MKKIITIALFAAIALNLCACTETKNPATTDNSTTLDAAPSNTKTVTCLTAYTKFHASHNRYVITYEADGVRLTPPPAFMDDEKLYDWDGNLIRSIYYSEFGELYRQTDCTYDQQGNQLEILTTSSLDGFPPTRTRFSYDADGRLLSIAHNNADDHVYLTTIYSYDDRGLLKEAAYQHHSSFDITAELEKRVFTCDDSGRILTCERYVRSNALEEMKLLYTYFCTYDDQGRLISSVCHDDTSTCVSGQYYTYDEHGRLSNYKMNKETDITYTYDSAGRLVKITDAVSGWITTLYYSEITLDAELADKAAAWAYNGTLKAFVKTPEFEY